MFEKFLSAQAPDFRQRYEGTYGFFRNETGKRLLAQLTSITDHRCIFTDVRGIEYSLEADSALDIGFEFLPPKSGFFNTDVGAVLLTRVPARQFQRGVSPRNITLGCLTGKRIELLKVDFPIIDKLYNKQLTSEESLALFEKKKLPSVAISPQIALDATQVWLLNEPLGTYTRKDNTYRVVFNTPELWRTEIMDAFKKTSRVCETN